MMRLPLKTRCRFDVILFNQEHAIDSFYQQLKLDEIPNAHLKTTEQHPGAASPESLNCLTILCCGVENVRPKS